MWAEAEAQVDDDVKVCLGWVGLARLGSATRCAPRATECGEVGNVKW